MASAFALAIFSGKIVLLCEWKMTAVIFHSPFHASGSRRHTASSHRTADSFLFGHESGHSIARPIALRATGSHPSGRFSEKLSSVLLLLIWTFYFLIFCKCFMPSSKRLRKASTSSGVLSAQKDTRMAVSMASGSRPMAASVWLG